MKNFKIIFALYIPLCSGLTLPFSPKAAEAAIGAFGVMAGLNISRSWHKRTNAVEIARHIGNPEFLQQMQRERIMYTGGAVLLPTATAAAIAIPFALTLPVVRVGRARMILNRIQKQPRFVPLHTLERNRGLLARAQHEVGKAKADLRKCNGGPGFAYVQEQLSEAHALDQSLESALAVTNNEIADKQKGIN